MSPSEKLQRPRRKDETENSIETQSPQSTFYLRMRTMSLIKTVRSAGQAN